MTSSSSRRADAVQGSQQAARDLEPSSGVGPALHIDGSAAYLWPLCSYLELGALPTAVPCARLHARHVLREWGMSRLAQDGELLVSELVTNAVQATTGHDQAAVRLRLSGDRTASSSKSGMPIHGRLHLSTPANTEHPTLRKRAAAGCSWWQR